MSLLSIFKSKSKAPTIEELVAGGRVGDAAALALEQGRTERAAELFLRAGDGARAAALYEQVGRHEKAAVARRVVATPAPNRSAPMASALASGSSPAQKTSAGTPTPHQLPATVPDGEMSDACREILMKTADVMSMAPALNEVLQAINDPQLSPNALATLVSRDSALLTSVMRVANSPFYRTARAVGDPIDAIVMMGFGEVRCLVVAQLAKVAMQPGAGPMQRMMWEHSMAVALAAQAIAREVRGITVSHAFTCGLLHDVGKAVIASAVGNYEAVWAAEATGADCESLELAHYGTHHGEVGAALLRSWQLPEIYELAIRLAHEPVAQRAVLDAKGQRLLAMVVLSDDLATRKGHGQRKAAPLDGLETHPSLEILGASRGLIEKASQHIDSELGDSAKA